MPTELPDTTPPEVIVATDGTVLNHVPPDGVQDKAIVLPTHTEDGPAIAPTVGNPFTVIVFVAYTG